METDPKLSQFVGQFVPLKVTSSGEEWQQWARKFKHEGSGIPILYVVRADGEQLYGKSGSLRGDDLIELMAAASQQSGRILNEAEFALLESCNLAAESALAEGELESAAQALAPLAKIGQLGGMQSYAESALKADSLAMQISEQVMSFVSDTVKPKLEEEDKVFEGVVDLTHAQEFYNNFPGVKAATDALVKDVKKDKEHRFFIKPAKALVKARLIATSPKASDKKRAEKAYVSVIGRYSDLPVAKIAREELKALNPESEALADGFVASDEDAQDDEAPGDTESASSETDASPKVSEKSNGDAWAESEVPTLSYDDELIRQWVDVTGKFKIEAKLIEVTDEYVRLKKENGSEVKVSLSKLGQSAKDYLESRK